MGNEIECTKDSFAVSNFRSIVIGEVCSDSTAPANLNAFARREDEKSTWGNS